MKSSALAWITCVLLLAGQLIFFYAIVSPQLQKKLDEQYIKQICGPDLSFIEGQITQLKSSDQEGHDNNHIEQVAFAPLNKTGDYCTIVIYTSPKPN